MYSKIKNCGIIFMLQQHDPFEGINFKFGLANRQCTRFQFSMIHLKALISSLVLPTVNVPDFSSNKYHLLVNFGNFNILFPNSFLLRLKTSNSCADMLSIVINHSVLIMGQVHIRQNILKKRPNNYNNPLTCWPYLIQNCPWAQTRSLYHTK